MISSTANKPLLCEEFSNLSLSQRTDAQLGGNSIAHVRKNSSYRFRRWKYTSEEMLESLHQRALVTKFLGSAEECPSLSTGNASIETSSVRGTPRASDRGCPSQPTARARHIERFR